MIKKPRRQSSKNDLQAGRALPKRLIYYAPPVTAGAKPFAAKIKPRRIVRKIIAVFLMLVFSVAVLIAVWDVKNISSASNRLFGDKNIIRLIRGGDLSTADNGRVNVLIVGYSADDPGHAGAQLTDSIILLSLNPAAKTGYLLSIPRDLYVNLGTANCRGGGQYCKINEAYEDGGMALLKKAISRDFNVQINYYALINYAATRSIVDALGGILVNINSPGGRLYDPNKDWSTGGPLVDLNNGPHVLNGQQALNLTRARGDPTTYGSPIGYEQSDFQRTANQRLVLAAIKQKLNWKLVLDPRRNGKILGAAADNIKTDVTAGSARPLFGLFNSIPNSKLKSVSLHELGGKNYLANYTTFYGQSALIPADGIDNYTAIQRAVASLD